MIEQILDIKTWKANKDRKFKVLQFGSVIVGSNGTYTTRLKDDKLFYLGDMFYVPSLNRICTLTSFEPDSIHVIMKWMAAARYRDVEINEL